MPTIAKRFTSVYSRLFAVLLLVITGAAAKAQLLTVSPSFPLDNSTVNIVADCSKGNQGLFNYANTSDVYVHVGVITNLSNGPSGWKYVKFTWGTTDPAAKATSLGNNRYQYTISNIRSFFGVPAGETIQKIAILFRSGNGNTVQRNSDGSDMYVPVYGTGLAGRFILPPLEPRFVPVPEPITASIGSKVYATWGSNLVSEIKLFFNGIQINTVNANLIQDSVTIATAGNQQLIARATAGSESFADTINFFVPPPVTVLPQPAGTRDGINYEPGDTSAILVLFAPNKTRVSLVGDFNNWTESLNYQMNRTPDGNRYWYRLTGLTKGVEYGFQYVINGTLRLGDPYCEKILDPNNDPFILSYPGLKPYPSGKTTGLVSVLQTAKPAYVWQQPSFTRPDKRSLVIYELLIRDFNSARDWKTTKDSIPYLKSLGVNAIELMPVNEFEGNISWGYNPSFYLAPDKYYGTDVRMKEFIDECHKQGIAVILDIALNHSFGQSPMVQMYFDNATGRPAADNPWFNPTTRHAFNVGYDMNHESLATRAFFSRVVEHWLKEYKIDGFRFDLSKGFTQVNTCDVNGNNCNVGSWGAYDASRVAIWKRYYDTLMLKSPGSYVILEHFADNSEEKELSDYGMLFWGNMNYNFSEATKGIVANSNFDGALHTARGWNQPHLISYMESHDEERVMYRNLNNGASSGGYNVRDLTTALRRTEMAASFLFMMPGPKMMWQFGEMGYDYSINTCQNGTVNDNCRLDTKPIRWDYLQDANRKRLFDVNRGLMALRNHSSFKAGFVTNRVDRSLNGAFKWLKLTTDTSNILVVGNFDVVTVTGSVAFQNSGTWYDYFTGTTFNATGALQSLTLQPGEYHVYVNRNVTFPIYSVSPVVELPYNGKMIRLSVYPNPVLRKQGTLEYEIPESGKVTLRLVNSMGQQAAVLNEGFRVKGVYKVALETLPSVYKLQPGTYFLQLEFGQRKLVQKLVMDF